MSFLRRLSRTKSADTSEQWDKLNEDKVKRKSFSGSQPRSKDEKQKGRERKHSENSVGKGTCITDLKYPLFYVHYLGRVPTLTEFGHESIEGPVDQLCKLREKEKLSKLVLTFNMEGLFFREITGTFNRVKKDGMFIYVPLHMVTYGVGSIDHPNVFACVCRTAPDRHGSRNAEMFIVHAFLCGKQSIAQNITYWQLQAYIEAYEKLKMKKKRRHERRLMNGLNADSLSIQTSMTTLSSQGSSTSPENERETINDPQRRDTRNEPNSNPEEAAQPITNDGSTSSVCENTSKVAANSNDDKPSQQNKTVHQTPPEITHSTTGRHSATSIESRTSKDSAFGDEITGDQSNIEAPESPRTTGDNPFAFGQATVPSADIPDITAGASGCTYDDLDTISLMTMPIDNESVPRNTAFEKRISDLNKLMAVDAEDLKSKLIKENPTLVRQLYYGTIDRNGLFHRQGLNIGIDSDNSYA